MIASYLAGVEKRIYFRHGIIYETSSGLKRTLLKNIDRLSGNLSTIVVCVSESVKKVSVKDKLNSTSKNIILGLGTCNGIDTENKYNPDKIDDLQRQELKKRLSINKDDIVIGYVGRIVRDKGINELIQAWGLLQQKHKNIKLLLVGPFEERDAVTEQTIKEIENNPNIIHTGFVMDSYPYYSIMDLFILPTYREGFPTVSLEASSMRIPVLITRATGCEESIIENTTGLFIKNEAKDIAQKIEFYINNADVRKGHGVQGR